MKYTFKYTYKEYENFPRATVVSETLASFRMGAIIFLYLFIIISALLLFTCKTLVDYLSAFGAIFVLILLLIFMIKVFPKIADRIVQKVIDNTVKRREQKRNG